MNFLRYVGKVIPDLFALAKSLGEMNDDEFIRTIDAWPKEYARLAKIRVMAKARHRFSGKGKP